LQFVEHVEGADDLAVVAGLVAIEEVETAGIVAECAEGHGGASAWGVFGGIVLIHFDFETGTLNRPETQETPAADGYGLDQGKLDFGLWLEFALIRVEEIGKSLEIFIFEDNRMGHEAVLQIVGRRTLPGFGGFSSAVLGSIGPRGLDLAFGSHSILIVSHSTAVIGCI
jgi:hypothetical protein